MARISGVLIQRRSANDCLVSNHIPIEMDEDIEPDTRKNNMESANNKIITEKIVSGYLHL